MGNLLRILVAAAMCVSAAAAAQQIVCGQAKVRYKQPSDAIKAKIYLSSAPQRVILSKDLKKSLSPQGTQWFVEIDPDYAKTESPWNTTLYIGDSSNSAPHLRIEFNDHGNTFSAHWINDKLLFVQVFWGRLASSDLIVDVEQKQFVYHEFAHYGELSEPCTQQ
jgi:hypothetical protein